MKGAEFVGMKEEANQLLQWLTDGEQDRAVISIVGMGGYGKTSLAANAYSSNVVKRSFDCYAWVHVSQNYMIEELLGKIINEFSNSRVNYKSVILSTKTYMQLVQTLVDFLPDKRHLLVLDYAWSSFLWKQVSVSLPDKKIGSRVIITTQKEDIASYSYGVGPSLKIGSRVIISHVLHSLPLSRDDAWTLFRNKAFGNETCCSCPPELEDIARVLVDKCEGLPLAILALGGFMASKDRSDFWKKEKVHLQKMWEIAI